MPGPGADPHRARKTRAEPGTGTGTGTGGSTGGGGGGGGDGRGGATRTTPAAPAPAPALRPAVAADLPFLVELRLATMAPHFARQGLVVSVGEHCRRAQDRLDAATIIEVDGHPVGVIKLIQDTRTWTIEQFQIAPAHQGRGLGTTVLRALIAEARHAGALLHLSVLKQNPAARLYARLGFRTLGESDHSYKMTFIDTEAPDGV